VIESAIALRKLVSGYRWGDVVVAEIRRDDELIPIEIKFRRTSMSTGN
jgi:hypothetical protein